MRGAGIVGRDRGKLEKDRRLEDTEQMGGNTPGGRKNLGY